MKRVIITIAILTWLAGIVKCDDHMAEALAQAGSRLAASGKAAQAEEMMYRALVYDSECGLAYFELARLAEKSGDKESAADLYGRAAKFLQECGERRDAIRKLKSLSPAASRMELAFEEYAHGLAIVGSRYTQDQLTTASIATRISSLNLGRFIPRAVLAPLTKKDVSGKWTGDNPDWTRPSIVDLKDNGTFVMLDKHLTGSWKTTETEIVLLWSGYKPDTLKRVGSDLFTGNTDRGVFTLRRGNHLPVEEK